MELTDKCVRNLMSSGFNLATYNSRTFAEDLDDLRVTFGASTLDLFGSSYGSRLAMRYSLDFPSRIRSILLTGPQSPQFGALESNSAASFENGMDRIFADCESMVTCSENYPHLRVMFNELLSNNRAFEKIDLPIPELKNDTRAFFGDVELSPILYVELFKSSPTFFPYILTVMVKFLRSGNPYSGEGRLLTSLVSITLRAFMAQSRAVNYGVLFSVNCYDYGQYFTDENYRIVNLGTRSGPALPFQPEFYRNTCARLPKLCQMIFSY